MSIERPGLYVCMDVCIIRPYARKTFSTSSILYDGSAMEIRQGNYSGGYSAILAPEESMGHSVIKL